MTKNNDFYKKQKSSLKDFYDSIDMGKYKKDLLKPFDLWEMDELNAGLGVTKKCWWESILGTTFANKRILDVGCGNSYHVPYWASIGREIVGLDSSRESLDVLQGFLTRLENLSPTLITGFAEDLNVKGKFDVVNYSNMLHHVDNPARCLKRAYEVMDDDGTLLVVEPIYFFPFRWVVETDFFGRVNLLKKYFIKKNLTFEEEKALSANTYINSVKSAGFEIVYIGFDSNFFGYALNLLGIKNRSIRFWFFHFDKLFTFFVPNSFKSFVYIIGKKRKQHKVGKKEYFNKRPR